MLDKAKYSSRYFTFSSDILVSAYLIMDYGCNFIWVVWLDIVILSSYIFQC